MLNVRRMSPARGVRFVAHDASHGMRDTAESEPHRAGPRRDLRLMNHALDTKSYGGKQDEGLTHE